MLNVPLLVGTLIALVILGPAAYCLHKLQARRVASGFVEQADGELSDWAVGVFRRDDKSPLAEAARQEADDARKEFPEWVAEEIRSGAEPVLTDAAQELLAKWVLELVLTDEKSALAAAARQEVDWVAAQGHLRRYLRLHPDDVDMQVRLAVAFDQSGKDPGHKWGVVKNHYYPVLGVVSGSKYAEWEPDLRRRLAELLIQIGRFASAESEAEKLLETNGKDPRARRLLAWALYGQFQSGALAGRPKGGVSVSKAFERALTLSPKDVQLAATLARIYRDKDKEELLSDEKRAISLEDRKQLANKANKVVDQMVTANPKSPEAFLARYLYRTQYKLDGAKDDLKSAREHGPKNLTVLLVAAEDAKQEAKIAQQKAAEAHQRNAPADDISKCLAEAGKWLDEASGCYGDAIKVAPSNERTHFGLGEVHQTQGALYLAQGARYQAQGEAQKAQDEFKKAQAAVELAIEAWRRGVESGNQESILLNSRLAEVLIAAGRLDEAWIPSPDPNKPEERAKAERAPLHNLELGIRKLAQRLRRAERASYERSLDLIQAKWFIKKGRYIRRETLVNGYLEAIPRLRRVVVAQPGSPSEFSQAYQAWMLLGGAYAALAQWDQAAAAYEDAASLLPKAAQPHVAAAGAWATAGRPETAVRHYEQALSLGGLSPGGTAETWFALSRAQLQCQVRLAKQERNWAGFDKALAEAKDPSRQEHLTSPWRLKVLEAEYAVVRAVEQGQRDDGLRQASKLLREAENEHSDSANLLQRLVLAYEQSGCPADADRALEKFDKLAGASVNACVLRSGLYSCRKQYQEARKVLQAGLTTLPPQMRPALQYALAQLSLDEGKSGRARQELSKLHDKNPANIRLIRQLADLAFQAGKLEDLPRWEEKLRKVEGPNGSWWRYYRARRLLVQAKDTDDPGFVEAAELHAQIQGQRPAWPAAHLLGGMIWQRRGNPDRAIKAYQEAERLGQRTISVYQPLIALLYATQRFAEAEQYLSRIRDHVPTSQSLSSLEISAAARLGELDRAVEAARRGVDRRPKDPMARVWLGQMLLATKQTEEAESAFREAVQLAPADVRTHSGLFSFYLRNEQPDRAKETLQELAQKVDLSEAQRAFVLAQGYEQLAQRKEGDEKKADLKEAEAKYREAQRLAPDNVGVQSRLAAFLLGLRTDPVAAEKAVRRLLQLAPQSGPARRALATILAARGGEKEWQEAQQLLERSGAAADVSNLDQRLQAMLLARRGGKDNLQKARRLLEQLITDPAKTTSGDRLLLARLYEAEDSLWAARQQYIALVGRADPSASHLALYVDLLLRHDLPDEAANWLKRLEEMAPDALGTVSLRTRWLHGKGRTAEIGPLVEQLADKLLKALEKVEEEKPQREAQVCLAVGNIYSAVEQHQAAERWYRRLAKLLPERYESLAMSLARQGRHSEAIELCVEAAKSDSSPRPAVVLASVLMIGKPTDEVFEQAKPLLDKAAEAHKDNAGLLASLANVRIIQQQTDDAVQLYRQVLKLRPKDVLALNNLATLLSEQSNTRKEALQYVDQAIQIAGPQAPLLDTKGTILVYGGQADQAIQWLEEAASALKPDPRYHLHLAVAYLQLGEDKKARNAFRNAILGDLTDEILTPTDERYLSELKQKLGQ